MIRKLSTHPKRYVTVAELAEYWAVSRQQIYKQIESGVLEALRLGPRLYRVRTAAALRFEGAAGVSENGPSPQPPGESAQPAAGRSAGGPPTPRDRSGSTRKWPRYIAS